MKILEVKIYSPDNELLREVNFNENGLSIIYGEVEKPNNNNETTNSIGKTVLLKILNVILGAKNSGKDTIKGLKDYKVKSKIKSDDKEYEVSLVIGNSKEYFIDNKKMNLTKYKEFFNIERSYFSKQIMLEKRKNLISNVSKNSTKDDYTTVLHLLYIDEIEDIFTKIKKKQDEIDIIGKYNKSFKEDTTELKKEQFNLEMKKKQIDDELSDLNNKLETLKISENIEEIAQKRTLVDQNIKDIAEKIQLNEIKIKKYNEILNDSNDNNISLQEVEKIYEVANIEIPEMVKRKLKEVEDFYKNLLDDKSQIYKEQIEKLEKNNQELKNSINIAKQELDMLSGIISENDSFREAIKIYDIKTKDKIEIDTQISEISGKLTQINNTQNIKGNIDILYSELYKEYENAQLKINRYQKFIYDIVNKIYIEETRNPYLSFTISDVYKYIAMPLKIDLSIEGDSGEGITAVKFLLFDLMIMNFNEKIEFLIEDSACFEGIDRRQIINLIEEAQNISNKTQKQLIISLNKYLISDYDRIKDNIVLTLSENNTLLNLKF